MSVSNQEVLDWVAGAGYFEDTDPALLVTTAIGVRLLELGRKSQGIELDEAKKSLLRLGTELYDSDQLMENLPEMTKTRFEVCSNSFGHTLTTMNRLWSRLELEFSKYQQARARVSNPAINPLARRRAQLDAFALRRYDGLFYSDGFLSVNVLLGLILEDDLPQIANIGTSCIDAATKVTESSLREVGFLPGGATLDSLRSTSYTEIWFE